MWQFYELLIAIFLGSVDIVLDKANWSKHASELMSGFLAVHACQLDRILEPYVYLRPGWECFLLLGEQE